MKKLIVLYYYLKSKYCNNVFSRKTLLKRQDKKVKKFIKNICKQSKYYQNLYNGLDINDWSNFPIISKKEYLENFDTINTVNITKEDAFNIAYKAEQDRNFSPKLNEITVGLSSGTSGNRGIFLVSDYERYFWAGNILGKILPKSLFSRNKIAFFLRANSNLYESVKAKNIQFEYFDLLTPIEVNLKRLNEYMPTIVVAPPSMLKILATEYNNKTLKIKPQKLISVAEVLDDIDKNYIEKSFNLNIQQIYQATEGFIATTCKYGHFHINEDLIAVQKEYIDKEHKKFIPIITDFHRTSQPIIRYRLNDILTELDKPCPCGSKYMAIKKIEGRCDDIFYLPSIEKKTLIPIFPDFLSRIIIFTSDKINDYKIIQISIDKILIYINVDDNTIKDTIIQKMYSLFDQQKCIKPDIEFITSYEQEKGKKFKRVESYLKTDNLNSNNESRLIKSQFV